MPYFLGHESSECQPFWVCRPRPTGAAAYRPAADSTLAHWEFETVDEKVSAAYPVRSNSRAKNRAQTSPGQDTGQFSIGCKFAFACQSSAAGRYAAAPVGARTADPKRLAAERMRKDGEMGLIKGLKEEIRIIRERDPAIHSSLEVLCTRA